ncbi:MAG: dihydroorotase family protein [Myxococcota bacterium]|nr:dihydroorotase family protein [Myxococcota bacterium]
MYDLVIEDATIVSGKGRVVADIGIRKGKIAYVGARAGRAREKINAIGKFIMPGIIDLSVHLGAEGVDPATAWAQETRAAVAAGVTTLIEMSDTPPTTRSAKSLSTKRKLAKEHSRANYGFWVQATKRNLDKIEPLLKKGAVGALVDLGASGLAALDDQTLATFLAEFPGVVAIRAEDRELLAAARSAHEGEAAPSHNAVSPPDAARKGVERVVALLQENPRPVHLIGLSTAAELHLLDPLRGNLPISVGTTPHHLFLNAEQEATAKTSPPLRDELDRRSLWTALKRQRIDAVSSCHAPYTQKECSGPYWETPAGIPGVETAFPLLMAAVHHGRTSLERMVELLAEGPARVLNLKSKGAIARGMDADLLLFSEGQLERLEADTLLGRAGWSPYAGRELAGRPEVVIVGGEIVARKGEVIADSHRGKAVSA